MFGGYFNYACSSYDTSSLKYPLHKRGSRSSYWNSTCYDATFNQMRQSWRNTLVVLGCTKPAETSGIQVGEGIRKPYLGFDYEPEIVKYSYGKLLYVCSCFEAHDNHVLWPKSRQIPFLQHFLHPSTQFLTTKHVSTNKLHNLRYSSSSTWIQDHFVKTPVTRRAMNSRDDLLVDNFTENVMYDIYIYTYVYKLYTH